MTLNSTKNKYFLCFSWKTQLHNNTYNRKVFRITRFRRWTGLIYYFSTIDEVSILFSKVSNVESSSWNSRANLMTGSHLYRWSWPKIIMYPIMGIFCAIKQRTSRSRFFNFCKPNEKARFQNQNDSSMRYQRP